MNRKETDSVLKKGYTAINQVFNALFEPVDDLSAQDNPTATDVVYLLSSVLDLIELAQYMVERVSDATWQETP